MEMRHFGILIPSTNTTCEIEYSRLLPPTLQVHTGRLGKGGDTPFSPSLDADLGYQAKLLGTACRGHDILYSTAILKKTGLRLRED